MKISFHPGMLLDPSSGLVDPVPELQYYKFHGGKFPCELCDKVLKSLTDFKRHLLTHTGEKPFLCTICNKSFRLKAHLNRHTNIHTGHKPFQCSICGKQFSRKDKCQLHAKTEH